MFRLHAKRTLLLLASLTLSAIAKPVPEVAFHSLDGAPHKLSSLRGEVVVLSFWATWCGPCQEELPRLAALAPHYAGKPVRFVAVSIDEARDRGKVDAFLARHALSGASPFEIWVGGDTGHLDRLGLGDIVPATLILDGGGNAVTRISGEAQDADIERTVDWLLKPEGVAPPAKLRRY